MFARIRCLGMLFLVCTSAAAQESQQMRRLPLRVFQDKMKGGWLGQMIGFGQTHGAQADKQMQTEAERIVSQYKTVFNAPPGGVPSRDSARGPLLGNGDLGAVISGKPESQRFWISKNNFWRMKDGHRMGGPRLFGGIEINIPSLADGTYLIEQQLYPAITTSRFVKGESTVTMRSLVAATEDVLLVELSVTGKPVEVETRLWSAPGRGSKESLGRKDGVLWATKAFAEEKIPTAAACVLTVIGGKVTIPELEPVVEGAILNPQPKRPKPRKAQSQPGTKFTLLPGQKVTVAVAMQSSLDAKDPLLAALEMATALTKEKVSDIEQKHARWWREFWAKSLVTIGDPILEQRYYLSNYVLGSGSRNPDFPQGLFGLWVTDDDPRWAGDYHLNYNYQAHFYGLYSCNHLEQADTFEAPVLAFMDRGRAYAKDLLKIRGVYYSVGIGAKGIETCKPGTFLGQKSNAAYCLANMAMRWYHTYDKEYATKVYPFVLEVANFWEDYLKFENGRYVIYDDSVHEGSGPDFNSIVSLGLVRTTLELAMDMSTELGVDAARQEKWQHILKNLSKFATQEHDGATVFRYTEKGMAWCDGNTVGIQHIYPAGAIGLDSDPKLLEVSHNTVRVMNRWIDGNGMSSIYAAAARVGYDPEIILKEMRGMIEKVGDVNGFTRDNVHGVENCSIVPNAINEMLCMGHGHVLRVFPVWPKNKDASFRSIRAWGAFLVSSSLKDGVVQYVKITSEKGRPCTLVNPWPGKSMDVYRDGKKVEKLKGERVVLKTEAGATVVLVPEGAVYDSLHGSMGNSQRKRSSVPLAGITYYVDAMAGDDSAGGGAATPWRSLARVNQQVFAPGDAVLFKAGCRWQGQLRPQGSGSEGHPIRIDHYGEGPLPIIDMGAAIGAAVQLSNQEYWEIRHLEITSGAPPAQEHRQGILVLVAGAGRVFRHIVVGDCHIHDIWGLLGGRDQGIDSYTSTAILVASPRGEQVATFDEVLIEHNLIERVDRSAIIVWTPTKAASATRVLVRHNRMTNLGGDAILILGSKGALVEYNVVNHAGLRCGDPNAVLPDGMEGYNACAASIWMHTCDHSLMQFNEVYDTNVQGNNQDGQAFDFDFDCRHCVLQYNYSRHNRGGWLLIMPSAEHNIARFNVSENDQVRLMCGGSSLEADNHLYNNVFYVDCGTVEVFTNAVYTNNIFYATGQGRFKISKRKPGLMSHNVYFGPWFKLPEDAHAMLVDPRFVAVGTGGIGLDSLAGYRLRADSPCRNRGMPIANSGGRDFWGNPLAEGEKHLGL
ncbi:MAG: hypothetical protein WCJ35_07965 [Planctomycetota bacterium]